MAVGKMLNETTPVYMLGSVGVMFQTSMAVGYMVVLGLGAFLPQGDYNPSLTDSNNILAKQNDIDDTFWRWIYLLPCFLNVYMLVIFHFFIKEDSIMFNLSEDREEDALRLIKKIYHNCTVESITI